MDRRAFLTLSVKAAMAAGLTSAVPASLLRSHTAHAALLAAGLSDPAVQPLFKYGAANALSSAFKYPLSNNKITIGMSQAVQMTGLVGANGVTPVPTTIWGYGTRELGVSWPGRTLEIHAGADPVEVTWLNQLVHPQGNRPLPHLLPVDTSLHWAYSLLGYKDRSIAEDGVPVVPHVHGGHNDSAYDGNPEYFFSPGFGVTGPRWVERKYLYGGSDWNDVAGMAWYHDHALGITRLNVYAGLAGFLPVRDAFDTGGPYNPIGLPADPYELGFAVQDRMFRNTGELFYPAFPGDPFWDDFITGEGLPVCGDGQTDGTCVTPPSALAEFFGDHILVNGTIWPKYDVEPRQYRVRLLNGCDSRFMRLRLKALIDGANYPAATDPAEGIQMPFLLIGSDQSLRERATELDEVDFAPGERLDLIIDFKMLPMGTRLIIENVLGDAPFGGGLPGMGDLFPERRTDRIMAFDITRDPDFVSRPDTVIEDGDDLGGGADTPDNVRRIRKLALFEGKDEFGRLQPLLGTAEPTYNVEGEVVNGAIAWHSPITENPGLGDTEIWEIYNATGDAHPVHVHLVHFEVLNRQSFKAKSVEQPVLQHDGSYGVGFRLENLRTVGQPRDAEPQEQTRRDMVTALPGEVTRIRMTFDKPGRYVWHCHILSHEDHEMMRPFHVGQGPY
jgi:spore coat protein A